MPCTLLLVHPNSSHSEEYASAWSGVCVFGGAGRGGRDAECGAGIAIIADVDKLGHLHVGRRHTMVKLLTAIMILCLSLVSAVKVMAVDKLAPVPYALTRFDGSEIHYYLDRRGSTKPHPVLILIQGSDCNSVLNNPRIPLIAEVAPSAAVLLVEKYAITPDLPFNRDISRTDCPAAYRQNNVPEQRVMDYERVVAELRHSAASWWNREIFIIGGSEGAEIALEVAAITPETSRLIVFGFGSRHFQDDVLQSIRYDSKMAALDESATEEQIAKMQEVFKAALSDRSSNEIISGYSHAYWASMLSMDQLAMFRAVNIPVLAIQGADDHNVSVEGARALMSQLKMRGRTNLEYKEYPGLDHAFADREGASHWDRVIDDMSMWLSR